ncbi:toprim domain-containing protein [Aestuariivita sp.]|jgi:hypothetical protein|uniref:toprim domain-containing protein n=1 Tax=Aestuariivita sp. TaxID=1872407 RepID=UPI0025BEC7EB|nr:toprim domain-containing protein [Aestuariivita sp.]
MNTQIIDAGRNASGGYKVDVSRGENVDRVSSEWYSRPDDERYVSLDDLFASVKARAEQSRTRTVESAAIRVEAHRDDPEKLGLVLPGTDEPIAPTHWSFGQLSSIVGAPAAYLRQLSAPLAGINLQYGLTNHRAEQIKTMEVANGRTELRAVTGPDYGRIYDHELVSAVQRIAGNGTGDTRWKVPGVLDWSTGIYSPRVDVTKETTTLYASDRDVFLFLVDDLNPIEAGILPDGSPDLYFRGFYCWNSEVGAKTLGIASFYLRAVCQNRNLWGVEDFQEIKIRHSKYAASRFAHEAAPALKNFANSSPTPFIDPDGFSKTNLGKAPIDTPRRAMGNLLGHAVRFGNARDVMAAGEGIETILSLRIILPNLPMAAALSAAHLAAIRFPPSLRRLYIARDNDPAGDGASARLMQRAKDAGIEAITLSPHLGDFNDDLRLLGADALRDALRVQIAPEDVACFMNATALTANNAASS